MVISFLSSNITSLGGPFQSEVFHDAIAQEEELLAEDEEGEHDWREWSLLATDGDTAALLELVSDGKVQFSRISKSRPLLILL